jgi:hypothetical protein
MYKTEYTLGLIGSILAAVFAFFSFLGCIIAAIFFNALVPYLGDILKNTDVPYNVDITGIIGTIPDIIIIVVIVLLIFAAASLILGFLGTAKLNKNDKTGGVLLITAGVLSLITICEFIPFVLFLIGGIMALTKKQSV